MPSIDIAFEALMSITDKCSKQIELINVLEKTYEREKVSIDAKVNSTTQIKNTFIKNTKVENKINNSNSTKEDKLKYFDETIKEQYDKLSSKSTTIRDMYENKMDREIEALENKIKEVKLKYEMKIQTELSDINQKAESYIAHLTRQRKLIEDKAETIIRDLSANIIVHHIGDVFDEDAYPRLTKLKFDIQTEKDRLVKLQEEKANALVKYNEADARHIRIKQEEAREREREEKRKEQEKIDLLIQQRKLEQEAQKMREQERQDEARKALLAKEAKEAEAITWKEKVFKKLSVENRKFIGLFDRETLNEVREMNLEEVVKHLEETKPTLINLQKLEDLCSKNDTYFSEEVWDMFTDLPFKTRVLIANQKSKSVQITLIKKYYTPKPDSSSEEE
jgi:hypothetical protein